MIKLSTITRRVKIPVKHALSLVILTLVTLVAYSQVPMPTVDAVGQRLEFTSKTHLKEFMDFHNGEYTDDHFMPIIQGLEANGFESLLNITKRAEYFEQGLLELPNEDIEDDLYIGDNRFATLLNKNHEIIIDGVVFKYEPEGVFFATTQNEDAIHDFIKGWEAKRRPALRLPAPVLMDDLFIYHLTEELDYFQFDYKNTVSSTITSTTGESMGRTPESFLNPYDLDACEFDDDGFFEGILPGSSEKCIDQFENRKRIVTKFSNQNYIIYSTVYAKVKSQKRNDFWWYRNNYCEFLELGLSNVVIKFPISFPNPPIYSLNYLIKNNSTGQIMDANGDSQGFPYNPDEFFEGWPFGAADIDFQIFFWTPDNEDINELLEDGIAALLEALGKTFEQAFETEGMKVGVGAVTDQGVFFSEFGERKRRVGVSKVQKTWDQNFLIKYKSGSSGFPFDIDDVTNARTYDVLKLDIYGVGKYNGNYHGMRIKTEGEVDSAPLTYDTDNDDVADIYDKCINQPGKSNYMGCPYTIRVEGQYYTPARQNSTFFARHKNEGSCYALDLKARDVPETKTNFQPDKNKNLNIRSAESIFISGETDILLSTVNSSESVLLQINPNLCDVITGPAPLSEPFPSGKGPTEENEEALEKGEKLLKVFPNPSNGIIHLASQEAMTHWELSNQFGSLYRTDKVDSSTKMEAHIDFHSFPTGAYFLKAFFEDGTSVMKVIIKE